VTLGAAVAEAAALIAAGGIGEARREARLVAAAALGVDPSAVLGWPERALSSEEAAHILAFARRRGAGEPLSRLTGRREFWSLSFALSSQTLDPRPDSEILVEAALGEIVDRNLPLRILDLGTGTGCLLLALLSELPRATGIGVDRSAGAAATARRNAEALGLSTRASFMVGDWGEALGGGFDIVVANPPYITSAAISRLSREVREHDPPLALDGGPDGLAAYRGIAQGLSSWLADDGTAVVEVGEGQAHEVASILAGSGLAVAGTRRDLAAIERCVIIKKLVGKSRGAH
jgi:release factor glutamine methyltransferase